MQCAGIEISMNDTYIISCLFSLNNYFQSISFIDSIFPVSTHSGVLLLHSQIRSAGSLTFIEVNRLNKLMASVNILKML